MPASADETGKAESKTKTNPRQHAEEWRPGEARCCRKAQVPDSKKSIRERAAELGTSGKNLRGWAIGYGGTGKVAQTRPNEQKESGGSGT